MWKIKVVTEGVSEKECATLCFAGQELRKYLSQATDEMIILGDGQAEEEGVILLGISLRDALCEVENAELDDGILIDVKERSGVITGVNARSALIAVYRYLTELGYVFIRPGKNGEKAPKTLPEKDVFVNEKPSYRHRAVCIEGSVMYDSIEDMVDWLPKVGMNGYYTQFFTPLIFFQRWYAHKGYEFSNRYLKGEPLSPDDVNGMVRMLEREIEKRGLLYYKVGHGWTCEPFGTTSYGWESVEPDSIPEEFTKYIALVNGKREIETTGRYAYVPMIVQLCYGEPAVRKKIVDFFIDYCKKNPHIHYMNFAFADGSNMMCECEKCRDTLPSDFLIMIMNEISERLEEEKLPTKISFFMYSDTLWPPEKLRFTHEDRACVFFCPISRTYTHPFPTRSDSVMKPFELNKLEFPESVEELLAYYREWRKLYQGDSAVFDYYSMWDCYKDLGGIDRSRVIHQDIRNYRDMNLNGLISCQGQRVFCPTSLGMNVMARTLWNRDVDFDEVCDYVIRAEYGEDFKEVRDYLQDLSTYSLPEVTRLEKPFLPANIPSYEKGIARAEAFLSVIEEHRKTAEGAEAVSWKYLKFHTELSILVMNSFIKICNGVEPRSLFDALDDFVSIHEWEHREYFDAFEFKYTYWLLVLTQIRKDGESLIG
ncbi:MAG: DUF4838 domain-containing protein [Clostridia bacterium]|nr:DUF4838 domain-containing protein [Clostridia bacterium]